MARRFLLVLLITFVAVLSGRPLLICTMDMASAAPKAHCPEMAAHQCHGCEAPAPAADDCMVTVEAPSGLPSVEQGPTVDPVHAITYQLAPVMILAPRVHALLRFEPVAFESPPASIQILRI